MGLNYELDVPQKIKQQLLHDPNSKQILINLTKKYENGELNFLFEQDKHKTISPTRKKFVSKAVTQCKEICETYNSVRPGEPTTISIPNVPLKKHDNHPFNKFVRNANIFCQLTMIKAANFR